MLNSAQIVDEIDGDIAEKFRGTELSGIKRDRLVALAQDKCVERGESKPTKAALRNLFRQSKQESENQGQNERLVALAEELGHTFFHNQDDIAYARIPKDGHFEIIELETERYQKVLSGKYHEKYSEVPSVMAKKSAIGTIAGHALNSGKKERTHLRIAWAPNRDDDGNKSLLIDLCDDEWRVVEVTADGWRFLDKSPIAFVRPKKTLPLPVPEKDGEIREIAQYANIPEAQLPLFCGCLLNCFKPGGPYFVVNIIGEQGSAKSTTAEFFRLLIDPHEDLLKSPPKDEGDLMPRAMNNHLIAFDNISTIPAWLSDTLCRITTIAGGLSKRSLYTNNEEFSVKAIKPVVITSIQDAIARGDLAERAIRFELEPISEENRLPHREVRANFERARPRLFGCLLDGLVSSLRDSQTIEQTTPYRPRMFDAAT